MTSALSGMSLESQRLRYGKYSLCFSDNKIYLSDGEITNYLDVSNLSIIEWTPDTEGTYPAIPGGTEVTTLNHLLTAIITTLRKHEHKTDDISNLQNWFEEKKPELKGADGKNGASAFDLWQEEIYGDIVPEERSHEKEWQYVDPSGFGDKTELRLITYYDEYQNRLNLFIQRTGKNALNIEEEADKILKKIDWGMTEEEIQKINDKIAELEASKTEEMTEEEIADIDKQKEELKNSINYGTPREERDKIMKEYAAKKAEWINWQKDATVSDKDKTKLYTFSLIYKEVSGYPGDNPTEWEVRYYTYNLYLAGDISLGSVVQIAQDKINQQQSAIEQVEKTASTAKKLGIAGTVLGTICTLFGIGNTAGEVVSYSSLQSQITATAAEATEAATSAAAAQTTANSARTAASNANSRCSTIEGDIRTINTNISDIQTTANQAKETADTNIEVIRGE